MTIPIPSTMIQPRKIQNKPGPPPINTNKTTNIIKNIPRPKFQTQKILN